MYPRKINRERERDYNSETGTDDQSQPLQLKRKIHPSDRKRSDYTVSIDDRRSRTPDEDIDDMDDEDDIMSNEHGMSTAINILNLRIQFKKNLSKTFLETGINMTINSNSLNSVPPIRKR